MYETIDSNNRDSSFDFKSKAEDISPQVSLSMPPYKRSVLILHSKYSLRIPWE